MKKKVITLLSFILFFFGGASFANAEAQNYVNDQAHILSAGDKEELNAKLSEITEAGDRDDGKNAGIQYAILTVNSTNGASIEDFAKNQFNEMGIGDQLKNRGVLFVIAVSDHEYRIQLGDGWKTSQYVNEANIEDYVFTDSISDSLRDESYVQAISLLTNNMIGLIGTEVDLPTNLQPLGLAQTQQIEQDQREQAEFNQKAKNVAQIAIPALIIGGVGTVGFIGIKQRKRKKLIKDIASLFNLEYAFDEDKEKLNVKDTELAEAFVNSKMAPTEANINKFFKAYQQNSKNYNQAVKNGKIEHPKRYNKKQIILDMTSRTNGYYYNSWTGDWWTTILLYNLISDHYYTPTYAASIAPKADPSSNSNDDWTNFGGGGFSSGGGASGSW
ncbi:MULTISPECIES: TPM domain-containing protein [unclassified Enterococcus]|uniref:TPM domain-containing protein n=1 Tax=unclassified Enterococcus TaxID=2608891 RepID=UPI0015566768|nr:MULTISPECIES: TPM domain-containing protein [unclassified Enterococcus]MBS7576893.1 TPM domain-containing protein [Enterococcus sp. MMGLQ5-2]MBS7584300.1 TPM domain-containing protein [Enterococcus sp. MMGLQ5-1]NPD12156.1 TPM domain-containing protein [Enterococcus sp. MMGLQ5-1]NPD36728.1 TPM domain-containing protein [Enterococcus sp. MMGLQ5-2]